MATPVFIPDPATTAETLYYDLKDVQFELTDEIRSKWEIDVRD